MDPTTMTLAMSALKLRFKAPGVRIPVSRRRHVSEIGAVCVPESSYGSVRRCRATSIPSRSRATSRSWGGTSVAVMKWYL
jgi:hypothetical protein